MEPHSHPIKLSNWETLSRNENCFSHAKDFGPEKTCQELATLTSAARIQYILSPGASWEGENAAVSSTPPGIRS
jgi:hypothetical protein